ncbi:MAG: hypothetical protein CMP20_02830 [Rickettsiales bacterium]|nr:hypothetical protein [Rickettsiales bacterium]
MISLRLTPVLAVAASVTAFIMFKRSNEKWEKAIRQNERDKVAEAHFVDLNTHELVPREHGYIAPSRKEYLKKRKDVWAPPGVIPAPLRPVDSIRVIPGSRPGPLWFEDT